MVGSFSLYGGIYMLKEKFAKLIDVKSFVTILLVSALAFLVIYSAITGKDLESNIFLLFSNVVTMIITYFFTKKKEVESK